jgi:hypothetical protein
MSLKLLRTSLKLSQLRRSNSTQSAAYVIHFIVSNDVVTLCKTSLLRRISGARVHRVEKGASSRRACGQRASGAPRCRRE